MKTEKAKDEKTEKKDDRKNESAIEKRIGKKKAMSKNALQSAPPKTPRKK